MIVYLKKSASCTNSAVQQQECSELAEAFPLYSNCVTHIVQKFKKKNFYKNIFLSRKMKKKTLIKLFHFSVKS